jgi:hypothetical protein
MTTDKRLVQQLLETIYDLVHSPGADWRSKRDDILNEASEDEKTALLEFCAWFE